MAWAVKQKVGNATGKAILLMLANYADDRGECFPSQERLAAECECSVATVARWLGLFVEMGFMTRHKQYGEGGYRRADLLRIATDLPVTKLPSRELPNSSEKLTHHKAGAEPIKEPISSLRSDTARGEPTQFDELVKVLDADHAHAVIAHRKNFKAKFSPYAAKLLAAKFATCPDANAAADAMIVNGWQGFEHAWMDRQQVRGSPPQKPMNAAQLAMHRAKEGYQNANAQTERHDRPTPVLLPQFSERRR